MRIDPEIPESLNVGRIDPERVDATTEADIARQAAADEAEAMQDVARFVRGPLAPSPVTRLKE